MNLRELAETLKDKNLVCLPVVGKRAIVKNFTKVTPDEAFELYQDKYQEATGIAVVCGKQSGIIALDLDNRSDDPKHLPEGLKELLPPPLLLRLGNPKKPAARFFSYRGEKTTRIQDPESGLQLDLQSDGTYIVLPPSIHPEGYEYKWLSQSIEQIDIDDLPELPLEAYTFIKNHENKKSNKKNNPSSENIEYSPGRCSHGSHTAMSAMAVSLWHKKSENYTYDDIIKDILDADLRRNKKADKLYFNCPTRAWKTKDTKQNAMVFLNEIKENHSVKRFASMVEDKSLKKHKILEDENGTPYVLDGFYRKYIVQKENKMINIYKPDYNEWSRFMREERHYFTTDGQSYLYDKEKKHYRSISDKEKINLLINDCIPSDESATLLKPQHQSYFLKTLEAGSFKHISDMKTKDESINFANGVLNVKTKKLSPHSPDFFFTYCLDTSYDPDAKCPTWLAFLAQIFINKEELIAVLSQIFGYIIYGGEPFLHKAFVLFGTGRNGKGTVIYILQKLIGKANFSNVSLSNLNKPFSVVNLDGKLANIVGETPTDRINSEIFKTATSGEYITGAKKYENEYEFECQSRFIFACNDLPHFGDNSIGLAERFYFIPFNRFFKLEERDIHLKDKLEKELPGILNWALAGLDVLLQEGFLPETEASLDVMDEYNRESDSVYEWASRMIEKAEDPEYQLSPNELFKRYKEDLRDTGRNTVSDMTFYKRFKKFVLHNKSQWIAESYSRSRNIRFYKGIKIKDSFRFFNS